MIYLYLNVNRAFNSNDYELKKNYTYNNQLLNYYFFLSKTKKILLIDSVIKNIETCINLLDNRESISSVVYLYTDIDERRKKEGRKKERK